MRRLRLVAATLDLAVEWHTGLERLFEGTESFYRGHDGMRQFWSGYRTVGERLIDRGGEGGEIGAQAAQARHSATPRYSEDGDAEH